MVEHARDTALFQHPPSSGRNSHMLHGTASRSLTAQIASIGWPIGCSLSLVPHHGVHLSDVSVIGTRLLLMRRLKCSLSDPCTVASFLIFMIVSNNRRPVGSAGSIRPPLCRF